MNKQKNKQTTYKEIEIEFEERCILTPLGAVSYNSSHLSNIWPYPPLEGFRTSQQTGYSRDRRESTEEKWTYEEK